MSGRLLDAKRKKALPVGQSLLISEDGERD